MKPHFQTIALLSCLFLLLASGLTAQQVTLHPPGNLSVCEDQQLQYIITGGTNGLQDPTLSLGLPCGITYQAGSISGAAEADIGNLSGPVFSLPEVPAGDTLTLSFHADVSCQTLPCIDAGELFFITAELEHAGGSQGFASDPFNVETANLLITNGENLYWQGTLNETVFRTLTIRNTRPGRVSSFEFLDTHASSIAVSSNDGETITENADTLLLRFGPQDFAQIGNGDGWFDFNEELTITERVQVVDCAYETRDALSELWVRWGCGGSFCQARRANGKVEIVDVVENGDVLNFLNKKANNPDCYDGGKTLQSFDIDRDNQTTDLLDFRLTLEQPGVDRGILVGSITNPLIDSVIYHNPLLSACGDSIASSATIYFINPLPTGGNINFSWETAFCEVNNCDQMESNWTYQYRYVKSCAAPEDRLVEEEGYGGSQTPRMRSDLRLNGIIEDGLPVDVVYQIHQSDLSEMNGELLIELSFPALLEIQATDFELGGVLPVSQNISSDPVNTINLSYPLPLEEGPFVLTVPTIMNCSAVDNPPCLPVIESGCEEFCTVAELPQYQLSAEAVVVEDEACSEIGHLRTCKSFKMGFPCFEGSCADTLKGYLDYSFTLERTTLGWPDKDSDLQSDADGIYDFDQMRLDRVIPGDTFELKIDGVVRTDIPGTELEYMVLEVGHDNFEVKVEGNSAPVEPAIEYFIGENKAIADIGSQIEIYDTSEGVWYSVGAIDRSFINSRKVFLYDLSIPSLAPQNDALPEGFLYSAGDSIRIRIQKRLETNFDIISQANGIVSSPLGPTKSVRNKVVFRLDYDTRVYLDAEVISADVPLPTCNCTSQKIEVGNFKMWIYSLGVADNSNCKHERGFTYSHKLNSEFAFDFPGEIKAYFKGREVDGQRFAFQGTGLLRRIGKRRAVEPVIQADGFCLAAAGVAAEL